MCTCVPGCGCYGHWWHRVLSLVTMCNCHELEAGPDPEPECRMVTEAAARRLARGGHTGTATLHGPERGHDAMTSWHTPHMLHTESWVRVRGHWRVNLLRWGEMEVVWTDAAVAGGHHGLGTNKHTNSEWAEIPNQWFALKSREMFVESEGEAM